MGAHRVKHLPVVDKEKLVGIVTNNVLDKAGPSELTTFSKHELNYLLDRLTVKEIMRKDPMNISPGTNVKEAFLLFVAQISKSRASLVMENSHLVGIVTTGDFLYRVLGPTLGIDMPVAKVLVHC
jgi:acetoin utilization protein AcuB